MSTMRPLIHPAIEDITVEGILHALSDPVRVSIYASLAASGSPSICSNFLEVSDRSIPKSTLSQHFKALREEAQTCSKPRLKEIYQQLADEIMAAIAKLEPKAD